MTRTLQQIAAGYLALCLAFAGMVGRSPILHLWIEHSGLGQPHAHLLPQNGGIYSAHRHGPEATHAHSDGQVHSHDDATEESAPEGLFVHSVRGPDASATFGEIWRLVARFIEGNAPPSHRGPDSDQNRHEHHGLVQLVTTGLVELNLDVPVLDATPPVVSFDSLPPTALLLEKQWCAQTSSRGPPPGWLTRA